MLATFAIVIQQLISHFTFLVFLQPQKLTMLNVQYIRTIKDTAAGRTVKASAANASRHVD